MKKNKLKNFHTSIMLILIVLCCAFWIVRVETRASALESRVEEYHKMLNQNKDELSNLSKFRRSIENLGFDMDMSSMGISLQAENSWIWMQENSMYLKMQKDKGFIQLINNKSYITLSPNAINLKLDDDKSSGSATNISLEKDKLSLKAFNAEITIDNSGNIWFETDKQINFSAKGEVSIFSEQEVNLYGSRINFNEF
jgi:hypothetical protein